MKKALKDLFKDWKTWFILGSGLLNIVLSICEKDFTETLWCLLATALYIVGGLQNIAVQEASEYIEKQENAIMEAGVIMATQAAIIKELNDKLDGQDSKDSADSGPREVSEESL